MRHAWHCGKGGWRWKAVRLFDALFRGGRYATHCSACLQKIEEMCPEPKPMPSGGEYAAMLAEMDAKKAGAVG